MIHWGRLVLAAMVLLGVWALATGYEKVTGHKLADPLGEPRTTPAETGRQRPEIPMSEAARATLLNLTPMQAQSIINSVGKSCPMVTGGQKTRMDSGDPVAVVACSDGSRYLIFWDSDDGHVGALSCSWGVC
jgi:hypothetical protein